MSVHTRGKCYTRDYNFDSVHFMPLRQDDCRRAVHPGPVSPPKVDKSDLDHVLCCNGSWHIRYTHVLSEVRCEACLEKLRKRGYADDVRPPAPVSTAEAKQ